MKNLVIIVIIVFGAWYFYNLGENKTIINDAKKDLGVVNVDDTNTEVEDNKIEEDIEEKIGEDTEEKDDGKASYTVKKSDTKNFIEIDDMSEQVKDLTEKFKLSGKILNSNVDKIVVKFKNMTSDFPNDTYQLQTFKKGNTSFEYNADSKLYRNLDYGVNVFTVEAYVGTDVSVVDVEVTIPENLGDTEEKTEKISEEVTYDKKLIGSGDDALYMGLPSSELFGNPLNLENGVITYSNVSGLEITKKALNKDFLQSSNVWKEDGTGYISTNDYWHIFANMDYSNKDLGVNFFVLRKDGEKVIYEKHYLDFNHDILGILKVEEFEFTSYDDLSELNTELKEKDGDFEEVLKTDKLFKEIVR